MLPLSRTFSGDLVVVFPLEMTQEGGYSVADTKIGDQSYPAAIRLFEVVYEDGVLKPLQDPGLPEHHHFAVQVQELRENAKCLIEIADEPGDLDAWSREIDELAAQIPQEDFDRLDVALEEADREAKEFVRRQMGLA